MFSVEFTLRAVAVVAAAVLVASPAVVAAIRAIFSWRPTRVTDDAQTVLEIARRFQSAGNAEGVRLCKSLIDVLLKPEKKT